MIAKLVDRLVSLEKKMDIVVAQTAGRPAGNGDQSKPFQSFKTHQPPHRDRVLYEAICADCHKVCEVPFKPSEDRAVYCKECFARRKSLPAGRQEARGKPYPVLTPVAMPSKPFSKPRTTVQSPPVPATSPKVKKSRSVKNSRAMKRSNGAAGGRGF
ncbi:MAG: hypothetical protein COT00_03530 [Candidatus Omnitrophica bacterium CG07_land_8_20_14_0_80_50_8]|nr:MAG: hypothetical protein COT00_03530 [Candidatus Omnitrophica bacterium CG07_land_8_20_14_0_80_50_8]